MRAVQVSEFGGPDVLREEDLPVPEPGPDQVLIEVRRAGINFADTHQRTDSYLSRSELPFVPGTEVAGVRADTGERVVALTGTGGYAQYAVAPTAQTFPIPDGVDDETALALVVQGLTAWHLYATSAHLRPGEAVVVHAGAGGVGSLAIQLGSRFQAGRVIATASSEEKRQLCLELGADAAIDSSPEDLRQRLIAANEGRRVDAVFEMTGGEVFRPVAAALAPFGRLVTYGWPPASRRGQRRRADARLPGGRRLLARPLSGESGDGVRGARRPVRARPRRSAACGRRCHVPAGGGRPGPP